jgi:uracil-DNA glycosylase family 4
MVPGEGNPHAAVVFVGEAPGAKEDELGRPFVGAAGRVLDELLAGIGLDRGDVFITNVLKARPPQNRDPRPDEVEHHRAWLDAQLEAIRPELVVPLGRHALARLVPGAKIAEVHGRRIEHEGRAYFPLYHPAVALYGRSKLPELEADMRRLAATLAE